MERHSGPFRLTPAADVKSTEVSKAPEASAEVKVEATKAPEAPKTK